MDKLERTEKLGFWQAFVRVVSVLVCACGVGSCIYSLSLQIQDVGSLFASICWFSGLSTVVAAIAAYVVTCGPQYKSYTAIAVVGILALGIVAFWLEQRFLWMQAVILMTLCVLVFQALILIVCHQFFKRRDPRAL